MGRFEAHQLDTFAEVLDDICLALQNEKGIAIAGPLRGALGRRIFELYENGITHPDELRLYIMADQIWLSARQRSEECVPLRESAHRIPKAGARAGCSEPLVTNRQ